MSEVPTEVIGDNTGDDYAGTEDAQLKEYSSTNNFGSSVIGYSAKYGSGDHTHILLKFSGLSNITPTVSVSSSTLAMYGDSGSSGTRTGTWRRVLRNWEEGTQNDADRTNDTPDSCCWDEYGSSNSWTTGGCLSNGNDRSATVTGTISMDDVVEYKTLSSAQLATDVQDMINNSSTNYGFHLERTDGENDSTFNSFYTSDNVDGSRPYLSVTYAAAGGGPAFGGLYGKALSGSLGGRGV